MFKQSLFLIVVLFVAVLGWQIGDKISSDSITMMIGLVFGLMAGIPALLMVLLVPEARRREREQEAYRLWYKQNSGALDRSQTLLESSTRDDAYLWSDELEELPQFDVVVNARQIGVKQ